MAVLKAYLDRFPDADSDWEEILRGPDGNFDVLVAYIATGTHRPVSSSSPSTADSVLHEIWKE